MCLRMVDDVRCSNLFDMLSIRYAIQARVQKLMTMDMPKSIMQGRHYCHQ